MDINDIINGIEDRLVADYVDMNLPTCLRPFIGDNYSRTLIITNAVLLNKTSPRNVDTPFDLYEDPDRFYSGISLTESQEKAIDVCQLAKEVGEKMAENNAAKTSSYLTKSAAAAGAVATVGGVGILSAVFPLFAAGTTIGVVTKTLQKKFAEEDELPKIVEDISLPLQKAGRTVNDVAIHRYYLRPCVLFGNLSKENDDIPIDNYYTEIDHKKSIRMLKEVIAALVPKNIIFSTNALAKQVAEDFQKEFGESFESFTQKRGILSDLNLTWDVCQDMIVKILKEGSEATGQKRLRLLSDALCKTVDEIREKSFLYTAIRNGEDIQQGSLVSAAGDLDELTRQIYVISDSIRLLVEEYKDKLKTRGTGKRQLSEEQLERRREIGRMKKPRRPKTDSLADGLTT